MASTPDRFRQVSLKLIRAKQHQAALEAELRQYLARQPYQVGVRIDTSRRPVYFVTSVIDVPDSIALIAGDTIQNLVSALDHLAYQLVCSATGDSPPKPRAIYFPIAEDAQKYENKKRSKLLGASAAALAAIDALRPYRGGDDILWELQELNNIEKHRLLLAVGAQAAGIHLGQLLAPLAAGVFPPDAITMLESMDHFLMPADVGYPLRPGL